MQRRVGVGVVLGLWGLLAGVAWATVAVNVNLGMSGSLALTGTLTPTALSGNVNDYAPAGLADATVVRLDGGVADRMITGLATGADGRVVMLVNIGTTNSLILTSEDSNSTAGNRFLLPSTPMVIAPQSTVTLRYDAGTVNRWRPWTQGGTPSSAAGFLSAGALTCGAGTAGKAQVHTTPLQYCDNAATPARQYAAYGDSSGNATALASSVTSLASVTSVNGTSIPASATLTKTSDKLSVFAATSSSELAGVLSDENATGGVMLNPMSAAGDLLYGGVSGVPTRLAGGSTGLLKLNGSSAPTVLNATDTKTFLALTAGDVSGVLSNPMTTAGDVLIGGASGTPTRLAGAAGFLKGAVGSGPSWSTINLAASADVGTSRLAYANLVQSTAAARLLGRGSASGSGNWEEITLASGQLAMVGTELQAVSRISDGVNGRAAYYTGTNWVDDSTGLTLDGTGILTEKHTVTVDNDGGTLGAQNYILCSPPTAGDVTFTLPAAASATVGTYRVIKGNAATTYGTCIVQPATGEYLNWAQNGTAAATTQGAEVLVTLVDSGGTSGTHWQAARGKTLLELADISDGLVTAAKLAPTIRSVAIPAGAMDVSGACALVPAAALVTNGPRLVTISCTDADADSIEFDTVMPDGWNAGTITVTLDAFSIGNNNTEVFAMTFAGQCVRSGDTPAAHATTGEQAATITWGNAANREQQATTAAITLQGTCAAGAHLYLRGQVDATATTMTPMTDLRVLGVKLEYTTGGTD